MKAFNRSQPILYLRNWGRVISVVSCGSFAVDCLTTNSRPGGDDAGGVV